MRDDFWLGFCMGAWTFGWGFGLGPPFGLGAALMILVWVSKYYKE